MKVALSVLAILAVFFTLGVAYAAEAVLSNSITYSDTGPVADCSSVSMAGAGGLAPDAVAPMLNGISQFELLAPGSRSTGICAGVISAEAAWIDNRITDFGLQK